MAVERVINMSTKGKLMPMVTRQKISLAKQDNRREVLEGLKEYIQFILKKGNERQIPSIVGASLFSGMSKKSLLAWELTTAENSEVRQLLDFIRDLEELYIREGALRGNFDSKIASLLLKAEHGLQEQPANLTQNNFYSGLTPDILAEALEISRKKPALPENKDKK